MSTQSQRPSLKTLEDAIAALEEQYAGEVDPAEASQQKATLKFLGALKELVQAFCRLGNGSDRAMMYLPFALRDK